MPRLLLADGERGLATAWVVLAPWLPGWTKHRGDLPSSLETVCEEVDVRDVPVVRIDEEPSDDLVDLATVGLGNHTVDDTPTEEEVLNLGRLEANGANRVGYEALELSGRVSILNSHCRLLSCCLRKVTVADRRRVLDCTEGKTSLTHWLRCFTCSGIMLAVGCVLQSVGVLRRSLGVCTVDRSVGSTTEVLGDTSSTHRRS